MSTSLEGIIVVHKMIFEKLIRPLIPVFLTHNQNGLLAELYTTLDQGEKQLAEATRDTELLRASRACLDQVCKTLHRLTILDLGWMPPTPERWLEGNLEEAMTMVDFVVDLGFRH